MNPSVDLRAQVRSGGIRMILYGFLGLIAGVVLTAIFAATGIALCITVPIVLASPLAMLWGFVQLVYPNIRFGHLGAGPNLESAIQHCEAETRDPATMYQKTQRGQLWLTSHWFVLFSDDDVMVVQRRDILYAYPKITTSRRSSRCEIKVRTRAKDYSFGVEEVEQDWFLRTIASAAPWAFFGYDPRLVGMPTPQLAYQVDQRMQANALPRG
jgi:hypothetical protein